MSSPSAAVAGSNVRKAASGYLAVDLPTTRRMKARILVITILLGYFDVGLALASSSEGKSATTDRPGGSVRSIREWTHCDGSADDARGVAAAFAAAKGGAFTLLVDCPVRIHIGMDIRRPIFVEDGTTVQFSGAGTFIVDNEMVPAFIFANTISVRLRDWCVRYTGREPIDVNTGGYFSDDSWIASGASPAGAFNDSVLTPWLAAHRNLEFQGRGRDGKSPWSGPTNFSALFFLLGSTSDISFQHFKIFTSTATKGSNFIPVVVSAQPGYKSGQRVADSMSASPNALAVPSNIRFEDIDLDGYYMGWVGTFVDASFEHIRAHRYGDLEDDQGDRVGGVGKWFAPPHLFYIAASVHKYIGSEPPGRAVSFREDKFISQRIRIQDVIDFGNRVGRARDRGDSDSLSGYANSLKIGASDSIVRDYQSFRPDGLIDLLASDNLVISNVRATYDSSFVNHLFPGFRFPGAGYRHVIVENLTLRDEAAATRTAPIGGCNDTAREFSQVTFRNAKVEMNRWAGGVFPQCLFPGDENHIDIVYAERHPQR